LGPYPLYRSSTDYNTRYLSLTAQEFEKSASHRLLENLASMDYCHISLEGSIQYQSVLHRPM
jgi:hypothetical protein